MFDENDVKRLVLDAGIVRHKGKIASAINNARRAQEMRQEFGTLAKYFWQFEPETSTRPDQITYQTLGGLTTSAGPLPCPRIFENVAGPLWDPPQCTPSCRQWAWSMITWWDVRRAKKHPSLDRRSCRDLQFFCLGLCTTSNHWHFPTQQLREPVHNPDSFGR